MVILNGDQGNGEEDGLWPSPVYYQHVSRLRQAIGQPIFLAEIKLSAINAGVRLVGDPHILLAVIDFPRPDPQRHLCPHMLVLDDGRGINLGHIARITLRTAFSPTAADELYQHPVFMQDMLFAPRTLSRSSLQATSRELLSGMFGDQPGRLLASCPMEGDQGKQGKVGRLEW